MEAKVQTIIPKSAIILEFLIFFDFRPCVWCSKIYFNLKLINQYFPCLHMPVPRPLVTLFLLGQLLVPTAIGFKRPCLTYGKPFQKHSLLAEQYYVRQASDCQQACKKREKCFFFAFFPAPGGRCELHIKNATHAELSSDPIAVVTGPSQCWGHRLPIVSISHVLEELFEPYCRPLRRPEWDKIRMARILNFKPGRCGGTHNPLGKNPDPRTFLTPPQGWCIHNRYFDQFQMEHNMLAQWQLSSLVCHQSDDNCNAKSEIIVVPSWLFLCSESKSRWWFLRKPNPREGQIPLDIFDPNFHDKIWNTIREAHGQHLAAKDGLLIWHVSFVIDSKSKTMRAMFAALLRQPKTFRSRVIFALVESNLENHVRKELGIPAWWYEDALQELQRRQQEGPRGMPMLVSLPYSTSIVNLPTFWDHRPRPVMIVYFGSLGVRTDNKAQVSLRNLKVKNRFHAHNDDGTRFAVLEAMRKYGRCFDWGCLICRNCDYDRYEDKNKTKAHMYYMALSSEFCVEPRGDTLTRSHFYVALASGCIPVLFDGPAVSGNKSRFTFSSPYTSWPFRANPDLTKIRKNPRFEQQEFLRSNDSLRFPNTSYTSRLHYSDFTISFKTSEVVSGKVNFVEQLEHMSLHKYECVSKLRSMGTQAGMLLSYSHNLTYSPLSAFVELVSRTWWSQKHRPLNN